jgi:predicted DCC family thiol-disulfide oxidoreductase YuxK/uncharacterized protein YqjF (DUF2071 family)
MAYHPMLPLSNMKNIFLTCGWKDLAMVNFEIDQEYLAPFVPAGTELDLWEGKTFVSLVGFRWDDTRIKGIGVPGHVRFSELNLRFYVKRQAPEGWRRGVCFIRELIGLPAAAWVANTCFGEKFCVHSVSVQLEPKALGTYIQYRVGQSLPSGTLEMMTDGPMQDIRPGSFEDFILSHQWAYASLKNGRTLEYCIERPAWQWASAGFVHVSLDGPKLYGPVLGRVIQGKPHSAFFVDGSVVKVAAPQKIPCASRHSIVIFDGVCHLCNGFVDFILKHDRLKNFKLLANQSVKAQKFLSVFGLQDKANESVYLVQGGEIYRESAAALRILKTLGFPWNLCYVFIIVPSLLRNMIYRIIAGNRYRWFGKKETCRLLPPQE